MRNKCDICNKKYGLIPFECKCGGKFCTIHRYPEEHNCTYDYKNEGKKKLIEDNPVVVKDKVPNRI